VDFRPGDSVVAEINDKYHMPNRPFFDRVEMKGGGDATSAARAVIQTGEYDYATNLQVDPDVLVSLQKGGVGRAIVSPWAASEMLFLNYTDPNVEVDGERSSVKSKHPFFSDLKVRQAVSLAVNRQVIVDQLYGSAGSVGVYPVFNPTKYLPGPSNWEYNLQKASSLLDGAGWLRGADGVRAKDGKQMKVLFVTSTSSVRQNTQAIIKKDLESIGMQVELRSISNEVYFSTDPANPDTRFHFYADMQMYSQGGTSPDPQAFFQSFCSWQVAQKANNWSGSNTVRYQSAEFDKLWKAASTELDVSKRTDLIKQMNQKFRDDLVADVLVNRNVVSGSAANLMGPDPNGFDSDLWNLPFWHRV
jgi:peptide/nickel transport system substrate-binding protein